MPMDPRILCAAGQPDEAGQSGGEPTDATSQEAPSAEAAPSEGDANVPNEARQSDENVTGDDPTPEVALEKAEQAVESLRTEAGMNDGEASDELMEEGADTSSVDLPEFTAASPTAAVNGIELLSKVNLNVRIELGRTKMLVEDVLRLNDGSVVELDKLAGDPVDIYVNDRHVACGEVLVLNDTFCVRISEIFSRHTGGSGQRNGAPRPRAA
jgi:flagellar motor switch protein FliN